MGELSERAQELLERLWVATEEEGKPGLKLEGAGAEVEVEAEAAEIGELEAAGLVSKEGGWLILTPSGRTAAAQAVRRHRLAERLLADVLATEEALIDEHACRFEHVLVDGVDESVCTLLGHPRFCPHGRPIPPGECCRRMEEVVDRLIVPLRDLQPGQEGVIAYIQMNNPHRLQKLLAMGVLPGVPIKLVRRFPSFVFEAGHSKFAIDEEIAADIYVRSIRGRRRARERHRRRGHRW